MDILVPFAFIAGLAIWNVPMLIRLLRRSVRAATMQLLIVDDKLTGGIDMVVKKLKEPSFVTQGGALVNLDPAKARRITTDKTGQFRGMRSYVIDRHSGVVLEGSSHPEVEHVKKEAARHVITKCAQALMRNDGMDWGPWVKAAVILGVITVVSLLGFGLTWLLTRAPGGQ